MIEVSVLGKRISYKIVLNNGFDCCRENKLTPPKHKSAITSAIKISDSIMMVVINLGFVNV